MNLVDFDPLLCNHNFFACFVFFFLLGQTAKLLLSFLKIMSLLVNNAAKRPLSEDEESIFNSSTNLLRSPPNAPKRQNMTKPGNKFNENDEQSQISIGNQLECIQASQEAILNKIELLVQSNSAIIKQMEDIKEELRQEKRLRVNLEYKVSHLEQKLTRLTDQKRKRNLIFTGIPEGKGSVQQMIKDLCVNILELPEIEPEHALKLKGSKGAILAIFPNENVVHKILASAPKLKGKSIYINRDFNEIIRKRRGFLFKLKKEIIQVDPNVKIQIRMDKFKLDDREFYFDENNIFLAVNAEGSTNGLQQINNLYDANINIDFDFNKNF